ncbi:hypothetical protein KA005_28385 [bacterium]|nr:hypothetical protein [bacterium]
MELKIEEVISEISDQWMKINGVKGIGKGKIDDKDCISVFVKTKTSEIEKAIPRKYKGFVIDFIETGGEICAEKSKEK